MNDESYLRFVLPELRGAAAEAIRNLANRPPPDVSLLPALREGMEKALWREPLSHVPWEERRIERNTSAADLAVYLINRKAGPQRPAILYMHGGGFVMGSAKGIIHDLQQLADSLGRLVVAPEYRLAPEATYVSSLEDNYTTLKWLYDNAEALGADSRRIAVMGESAGGGHAALLAIAARDRGEIPIAFQCLIYPMLDDRTGSTRKTPPQVGVLNWTPDYNRFGWQCFLGAPAGSERIPTAGVPARTKTLAGLPPTFIGVGALDLFHRESVEYAQRLNDAGGFAELLVIPGAFHGFDMNSNAPVVEQFSRAKVEALQRALQFAEQS